MCMSLTPIPHRAATLIDSVYPWLKSMPWFLLTCYDLYWHAMLSTDMPWSLLTCHDLYWHAMLSTDMPWSLLTCHDLYWHAMISTDMLWSLLTCHDLYYCFSSTCGKFGLWRWSVWCWYSWRHSLRFTLLCTLYETRPEKKSGELHNNHVVIISNQIIFIF